ncbi:SRPBCC family protein [Amycolatopsis saalfeldensis]|uniref:Polyketide cyclase / dehydrase and lipid transport n=1 Tax=Amycolatopsis saalfeldensis TaxID=394193 RepID=A0A1H8Q7G1_9PSEU|nr:SRPBCC family protein [Amycolatopsis saalfeldensis]SEO49986.1 Polyketide cyclase / dehydrase and lipid transport [Amycolatopsis saalfeldensis]
MNHKLLNVIGVVALSAAAALSAQSPAMAGEARPGPHEECRGVTVDENAPVISRASVFIQAPLWEVWRLHTDVDHWAKWIPEITPAHKETPGPLRPGSVFDWSPQGMKVTSTVKTVAPGRCIAWGAPVNGITGVHLWTFKPAKGGVVATTEESWAGPPVDADVPGNQSSLDKGLGDWVNRLKDTSEARSGCH